MTFWDIITAQRVLYQMRIHAQQRQGQNTMSETIIEVQLETMANGGSALGRSGEQVVFIPYTIPGERVQARVLRQKGRTLFAEGVTLLESSADRVFPACEHFGPARCGGCQWQHIQYEAQLLLKQDVLSDQLERIAGISDPPVQPFIPSPEVWGYNQQMTFYPAADGQLGLPAAKDDSVFAVQECLVLHPDLLALKDALDLEQFAGLEAITLVRGSDGGLMCVLRMQGDEAPELQTDLPMSVNLLLSDGEPVNLIGDLHTVVQVGDHTFRLTAGGFMRANTAQLPHLAAAVLDALRLSGREQILDLYAGIGWLSAFIAPHASHITLVEDDSAAVDDADFNLSHLDHVDIIEGRVEDVLPELDGAYDAALIDPPAEGLSAAALDALVARHISRLVYVSSDPATLARDAKRLAAHQYRLTNIQPLDFAPQTFAIDCVAVFER